MIHVGSILGQENLVNILEAAVVTWTSWNFDRINVLIIPRLRSNIGHAGQKLGH